VHHWHIAYAPKIRGLTHRVTPGFGHSLLSPLAASIFQTLRVSAAVYEHGEEWVNLHGGPSLTAFEFEHGKDLARARYNDRCLTKAQKLRRTVRGEHAGYADLFVPIVVKNQVVAVLVTGPFALRRPTATDVLERWRELTRRQGDPADPEFNAYLTAALSVLVLDGDRMGSFEQLLECLVRLMAGEGDAAELMNRIEVLRSRLAGTRLADRAWDLMREIVDQRSVRNPHSGPRRNDLRDLGLSRDADHVLVGLTVSRTAGQDPVDEAIRRDGFQRGAVELARATGDVIAGRIGDHGVVFLSGCPGSAQRKRQKVRDLAERAAALARRHFRLATHFGASVWSQSIPLSRSYQAALAAAESALVAGTKLEILEPDARRPFHSLRRMREELGKAAEEQPHLLGARFDRYLEAVAGEYGYRLDPARAHLEIGFDRLAEVLLRGGAFDEASLRDMRDGLDRAAEAARNVSELFSAYRRAAADLSEAVERPPSARRDRHLRNALEYMHRHYSEPLSRKSVARVAGFAPGYFSLLFKRREHKTFEAYLAALRVERAKQLLEGTDLDARRVGELSGFSTPQYFSRAFRRATKMTPLRYRKEAHRHPTRA
jgi:AraC-like DNA-binding protein